MHAFKEDLPHTVGFALDNEEITFPNYVPTHVQSLPHTSNGIRQLVIDKQNQRVLPTYNRLLDRMEDALVRWRPPASSHVGSSLAIHGTHPYQKEVPEPKALGRDLSESIEQMKQILQNCWPTRDLHTEATDDSETLSDYSLPRAGSATANSAKPNGPSFETLSLSRRTPVAFPIKASGARAQPPPDDLQSTLNTYKFPVPSYYLPLSLQRQCQQPTTRAPAADTEQSTPWQAWCQFWKEFWVDLHSLLICQIDEELY
ncbi:AaceriADR101Wp [[Ashbya] aceris (nom. inval.)]|nr:AaceriADR101Wp [[Ashbya] aceris (nom. inval.)]